MRHERVRELRDALAAALEAKVGRCKLKHMLKAHSFSARLTSGDKPTFENIYVNSRRLESKSPTMGVSNLGLSLNVITKNDTHV
jgi:hypothetical protein